MDEIKQALAKSGFSGDVEDDVTTLETYSHDSMFEIKPKLVIAPKTAADVEKAVKIVADRKPHDAHLSIPGSS